MKDLDALLARIADGLARGLIDQRAAAHYLGAHLSRRLYCSRVALWTFRQVPGCADITRVGGYDARLERPLADVVTLRIAAPSAWLAGLGLTRLSPRRQQARRRRSMLCAAGPRDGAAARHEGDRHAHPVP